MAIHNADIQFTNDTANISEGGSPKNKFAGSSLTSVKKFICDYLGQWKNTLALDYQSQSTNKQIGNHNKKPMTFNEILILSLLVNLTN